MTAPYLALGLSGPHLLELAGHRALLDRWDALPAAFTVLGIDRIDGGSSPASVTVDSSAAGASIAARTTRGRFLIVASPQRDHPYNLARRVASESAGLARDGQVPVQDADEGSRRYRLGHVASRRETLVDVSYTGYTGPGPAGAVVPVRS